jgi:DNA-binding GntR family transcriptional regulator
MAAEPALATAQQEAYRYLRDRILGGELAGDTRLNPVEIAELLGISRMPVREALRQLDAEGLVTMRPNRAAHVTRLTALEIEDLFEIRTALEVMAVKSAVHALSQESLADLVALKERMDRARKDPVEWLKRHEDFHHAISALGNRKRLQQEIARVRLAIRPYLLMYMKVFETVEMPGLEHSSLLEALSSGNIGRAEEAMRLHVANPAEGLIKFLREREAETKKGKGSVTRLASSAPDGVPQEQSAIKLEGA